MPEAETERAVAEPAAPAGHSPAAPADQSLDEAASDSPAAATMRGTEVVVYLVLFAFSLLLAFDNWRSGMGWAKDGPQSGYLPFYLCVLLAGACLFGLGVAFRNRTAAAKTFVTRDQLWRVMQVFVPTFLFCVLLQWLGLYVASFLLVAGFMRIVGRIAWWKSLLTALLFAIVMFATFDVAFDVIMPKGPLEAAFGR
jgi:putative tricarboxylic transport membrane protein